ncbi:MAG TPA: PD-(D/E)XK nuclease family protein [Bacteroidia bacterium]|nr:PD-(D/E)XK nuclease family protein [Bacteroidia bacterium]
MGSSTSSFIDKIVRSFVDKQPATGSSTCFIFPTRRACLIFRNKLATATGTAQWAPGILSISDFVSEHCGLTIADEKELLFLLFRVNRKFWPEQTFTRFHSWGQMLLNDFDEVDKQLEDPTELFISVREIRQLEQLFADDQSALEWITRFTGTMNLAKLTDLQARFAENWDRLIQIYHDFRSLLLEKKLAYEGLAYRQLLERISNKELTLPYSSFVFGGFYGFSKIEEQLIYKLKEQYAVQLEWDADQYYTTKVRNHEAGNYFRTSHLADTPLFPDQFSKNTLAVTVTGVPLQSGQSKYAGQLIEELLLKNKADLNTTAIVLPDEGLLFPMLYSLPKNTDQVNVTMGLPLKQTIYADLIRALNELYTGARKIKDGDSIFYYSHLEAVLNNPLGVLLFKKQLPAETASFSPWIKSSDLKQKVGQYCAQILTEPVSTPSAVASFVRALFDKINSLTTNESGKFENEVTAFIASELKELELLFESYNRELSAADAWQIITEVVNGLKLPFSGEPVRGLQVMGFLETRALDFETLIFLSFNEDILPKNNASKSFIPFSLRRAFGLSTYIEQDASSAYHFYRLLHKAKNVHLIYDTEIKGLSGSEPSRYILQLQQELKKYMGERLKWSQFIVNTPIEIAEDKQVSVPKNSNVMDRLKGYISNDSTLTLSATALTTYISCSLRFYYNYIAGIKESSKDSDSIEADVFGNILHLALENLYKPYKESTIDTTIIQSLIKNADEAVDAAIHHEFKTSHDKLEGNDKILAGALRELVKRILKNDLIDAPFTITGLEESFTTTLPTSFGNVKLLGRFDRIDSRNGVTRIIDYKTGKVKSSAKNLESIITNPDYKTLFQLFFYTLVYQSYFPDAIVEPGFYVAQKLNQGLVKAESVNKENVDWFKEQLTGIVESMFNPEIPFQRTDDIRRCTFCPYADLCHR